MLKEAIETIANMAIGTTKPTIAPIPGDPRTQLVEHAGTLDYRPVPPPLHCSAVNCLDSLTIALDDLGITPQIWHSHSYIIALPDRDDRRESINLRLEESDHLDAIRSLPSTGLTPRDTVIWIKRDMAGALDPTVADPFRHVDFQRQTGTHSQTKRDAESLGRSVENAITPHLPDVITATISVYAPPFHYPAPITLDVTPLYDTGTIQLKPLPGTIAHAIQNAQRQLHEDLLKLADTFDPPPSVIHGEPHFSA